MALVFGVVICDHLLREYQGMALEASEEVTRFVLQNNLQ